MLLWNAAVALSFNAKISAWTSAPIALVINEPFSSAQTVTSLTSAVAVAQFPQKVWVNEAQEKREHQRGRLADVARIANRLV